MEEGKFYLFACPWDWTFVGRYVKHLNFQEILIEDGGYFTYTGATFDVLCSQGFQPNTNFHPTKNGVAQIISAQGPKWQWLAPTPWVKKRA